MYFFQYTSCIQYTDFYNTFLMTFYRHIFPEYGILAISIVNYYINMTTYIIVKTF